MTDDLRREVARYSMPEIFAAINRHAQRRADWLNALDKDDPVRIMAELANAAGIYMSQPFEHNRVSLKGAMERAERISDALLGEHISLSQDKTP